MLPCQNECPFFHTDCHKTCAQWVERQNRQREENLKRKNLLKIHNQLCSEQLRQLQGMMPARSRFR